jgi:hypothetical protein
MPTLTEYAAFVLPVSGDQPVAAGRNTLPRTLAVSGGVDRWTNSVATATTVTLWDASNSAISSFLYAWIASDQLVTVEYQGGSAANNAGRSVRSGFPEIHSTGTMPTYAAGGGAAGTVVNVTKVVLRNASGSTANIVAIFIL